jgi:hypothetical protein
MPIVSYFFVVGSILAGLLFSADRVLQHTEPLGLRSSIVGLHQHPVPPKRPEVLVLSTHAAPAPDPSSYQVAPTADAKSVAMASPAVAPSPPVSRRQHARKRSQADDTSRRERERGDDTWSDWSDPFRKQPATERKRPAQNDIFGSWDSAGGWEQNRRWR